MTDRVTLAEGKYEIIQEDGELMHFRRHGEPWPAAQEGYQFSNLTAAMFNRIVELETENEEMADKAWKYDQLSK